MEEGVNGERLWVRGERRGGVQTRSLVIFIPSASPHRLLLLAFHYSHFSLLVTSVNFDTDDILDLFPRQATPMASVYHIISL